MDTCKVTIDDIRSAIRQLGIAGKPVCLHSSLRSFGWVEGGAKAVVEGFLTEGCTLLAPTFSDLYRILPPPYLRPERNGYDYSCAPATGSTLVYTPDCTVIDKEMGAIPEVIVNIPSRVRGNNPIVSFTAIGPLAAALIGAHPPQDAFTPLLALAEMGGVVLLAGVGYRRMTLIHAAEILAGRTPFRRWANGQDGHPMMVECGGCSEGFEQFAPYLGALVQQIRVGESEWTMLPAHEALETATAMIRESPDITHCGDPLCERCRDAILGGPILKSQ